MVLDGEEFIGYGENSVRTLVICEPSSVLSSWFWMVRRYCAVMPRRTAMVGSERVRQETLQDQKQGDPVDDRGLHLAC